MDEAKRTGALIRGGEIRQLRARIAELEAENASLRERHPLSDEQIEELLGEANRGYDIESDDYFKAFRDAERAHGIKE